MNLCMKQTHRHGKQIYGYQKGKGGGLNQEVGINIYTLLYIKQITIEDLPYSARNYTLLSIIITYNGKQSEKEYIYIYIYN